MLRPQLPPTLWDDLTDRSRNGWLRLVAFLALCNLSFGFLADVLDHAGAEILAYGLAGCIVAECGILPAWLVWGGGPFWQRLLLHAGLAVALSLLWYGGMLPWLSHGDRTKDVPMILFSLPPISVGVSVPLWLMRLFFGWRIVRPEDEHLVAPKLAIRDFFVGMAVVGVALASARLAMAIGKPPQEWAYWLPLGIAVGIAAAAGLSLALPVLWFTFRFSSPLQSALAVGITMLMPWALMIIVVTAIDRHIPDGRVIVGMCLFFLSVGYTTAAAFWLARAAGYRLQVGRPAIR